MTYIASLSNIARSEGDPKVLSSGPSSLDVTDRLARALGWFSIGLGIAELVGARHITRLLGIEGSEGLIRAFGAREIGAGIVSLSVDKHVGLWSRVAGDALDLAALAAARRPGNPKRHNVDSALAMVAGITLLDILAAQMATISRSRGNGKRRSYANRSGFPNGVARARGSAKEIAKPAIAPRRSTQS
jgi:hypothetical protein